MRRGRLRGGLELPVKLILLPATSVQVVRTLRTILTRSFLLLDVALLDHDGEVDPLLRRLLLRPVHWIVFVARYARGVNRHWRPIAVENAWLFPLSSLSIFRRSQDLRRVDRQARDRDLAILVLILVADLSAATLLDIHVTKLRDRRVHHLNLPRPLFVAPFFLRIVPLFLLEPLLIHALNLI